MFSGAASSFAVRRKEQKDVQTAEKNEDAKY